MSYSGGTGRFRIYAANSRLNGSNLTIASRCPTYDHFTLRSAPKEGVRTLVTTIVA